MSDDLNDSLANLFSGDIGAVRSEPVKPVPEYKTAETRFVEGCPKCRGTGRFVSYSGRVLGQCFACKGAGKREFKTSTETRAANREANATRKAERIAADVADFAARNPVVFAWLEQETSKREPFAFAVSIRAALDQYGDLTVNQLNTCQRLAAKAAERVAERAQRAADAPTVEQAGIDRLKESFDKAIAYSAEKGLKLSPRITIDGITISPAKANSANPGALYVKAGSEYLGKIVKARFYATSACTTEHQAKLALFLTNPAEAAKVYGQTTGTCCICNATLRSEWKHRGIGPICAEKFGWV